MVKITYIENNGTAHMIDARPGLSLMENAVKNCVPGIVGECGGSAACGTCRIYVDAEWLAKMNEPGTKELPVIEFVGDRNPGVRLSCQIEVTETLDGLRVRMPKEQYS
jgi:2Fe-2S ferredoxin